MSEDQEPRPLPLQYATPVRHPRRVSAWTALLVLLLLGLGLLASLALLPSRNSGGTNPRVRSASNLHLIGQGILLYQNDFNEHYPDSFVSILENEDLTASVFVSPMSTDTPAIGPTTQATAQAMLSPGHCSYVYLGRQLPPTTAPDNAVIAYERPDISAYGSNVLFGDGHVEFEDTIWMKQLLAKLHVRSPACTQPTTMPTGL